MWPLLRAQGNRGIKNFVARSGPGKPSGSRLKREDSTRRPSDKRRNYKHPPKGSDKNRDEVSCLQRLIAFGRWSV
jgi:hypothetical protein